MVVIRPGESHCASENESTEESEECGCESYSARPVGPWSECILEEGAAALQVSAGGSGGGGCGRGKRYRRMDCLDSAGHLVDGRYEIEPFI